jgi:rRNA maturation endonuclease Nob1
LEKKIIILDTSAFIAGFDPFLVSEKQYTVPDVRNELDKGSLQWIRFNNAINSGKVIIIKPKLNYYEKVIEISKKLGDIRSLSNADLQVLALALELKNWNSKPLILTDDYSIQNVANKIGIEFASIITFGIRYRVKWILYCPACYHRYPSDYKLNSCKICGSELKRKPKKKTCL